LIAFSVDMNALTGKPHSSFIVHEGPSQPGRNVEGKWGTADVLPMTSAVPVIARYEAIAKAGTDCFGLPAWAVASCPARRSVPLRRVKSKAPALR
jgi:hypothetical protein